MPENMPRFRAPSSDVEKSVLPQDGVQVTVAQAFSDSEMAAQVKEAAEYKHSVGNPLAPDCPACNQPTTIKTILDKAKSSNNPTAGKNGNTTPGMSGLREDPWTNSGMQGVNSLGTGYYNPGARGGMSTTQKTNKL